jgi:hypothetical protein
MKRQTWSETPMISGSETAFTSELICVPNVTQISSDVKAVLVASEPQVCRTPYKRRVIQENPLKCHKETSNSQWQANTSFNPTPA